MGNVHVLDWMFVKRDKWGVMYLYRLNKNNLLNACVCTYKSAPGGMDVVKHFKYFNQKTYTICVHLLPNTIKNK